LLNRPGGHAFEEAPSADVHQGATIVHLAYGGAVVLGVIAGHAWIAVELARGVVEAAGRAVLAEGLRASARVKPRSAAAALGTSPCAFWYVPGGHGEHSALRGTK
jgi:hypothetical protein